MGEMIQRLKRLDRMRPSAASRAVLSAEEVAGLVVEIEDLERRAEAETGLGERLRVKRLGVRRIPPGGSW